MHSVNWTPTNAKGARVNTPTTVETSLETMCAIASRAGQGKTAMRVRGTNNQGSGS